MQYAEHLSKDKKFKKLLEGREPFALKQKKKVYLHLCGSIMSQQLSVKVADVIWKRFLALYDKHPTPEQIVDTPFTTLRGVGLSNAKVNYVQNVAKFAIE
ncbi:MAG: DNA-3-methyladenine glycosylase 2 family protein, partial [Bacteroidota bacterium]